MFVFLEGIAIGSNIAKKTTGSKGKDLHYIYGILQICQGTTCRLLTDDQRLPRSDPTLNDMQSLMEDIKAHPRKVHQSESLLKLLGAIIGRTKINLLLFLLQLI